MEPLLEVSGLEKRLGTLHLNQISFRVEPGHIAGLVGVNGARENHFTPHHPESV